MAPEQRIKTLWRMIQTIERDVVICQYDEISDRKFTRLMYDDQESYGVMEQLPTTDIGLVVAGAENLSTLADEFARETGKFYKSLRRGAFNHPFLLEMIFKGVGGALPGYYRTKIYVFGPELQHVHYTWSDEKIHLGYEVLQQYGFQPHVHEPRFAGVL
jgi:hypothetical protein